ncbi:BON domain-containing protein [Macromonas nakdongensis]|uniref:BON domain-containing protein n=1 Tax=Macromonas nakdongensis TaxID=1843082 RepID=UPI000C326331|nr:BON domain-containing protein [Macromonas nakdongensis]
MTFANRFSARTLALLACVAALGGALSACAPLVVGAAVGSGVMVATDRRTSGAQVEDEAIELKSGSRIREALGSRVRVSVTSFNAQVLLTGEVGNEADKQRVQQVVLGVEHVRSVVNELTVSDSPSLVQRSSDALLTARVKAAFVDASDLSANVFKVVTERDTVYLMGLVTQREADRASAIARSTGSVKQVVRIFELISDAELARLQAAPGASTSGTAQPR